LPINTHSLWFDVSGATYRFRVVATFASENSQQSPSSEKVYMTSVVERHAGALLPAPVIVEARALSNTEIFIGWQVGWSLVHIVIIIYYYAEAVKQHYSDISIS